MAEIYLNDKEKTRLYTKAEAECLRGFLTEAKYREIRIGRQYFGSTYSNQKKVLERKDKKKYLAVYDDYTPSVLKNPLSALAPNGMPLPVPVAKEKQAEQRFIPPIPMKLITVVGPDGCVNTNMEKHTEEWLDAMKHKVLIDTEYVLKQLEELVLDEEKLGDFTAVTWEDTVRTPFDVDIDFVYSERE